MSRPRLLDRLSEGLHKKLTLVSAPAGYGKSTLLGAWVQQAGLPVAWLSLDQDDNDHNRFLLYTISALKQVLPSLGETILPLVETPQPPPTPILLTALINELNDLGAEIALVFDDFATASPFAAESALVYQAMVLTTQLHEIVETGLAALAPVNDVVSVHEMLVCAAREPATVVTKA